MRILDRKFIINSGFALALAILASIGWFSYTEMTSLVTSEAWERNAHSELLELVDLLSKLREVESMNRGFIITGNEKYLEPYLSARSMIEQKLEHIRKLKEVNQQQKRLDGIDPLIREKLAMIEATIQLRRTKGFQASSQAVMTGRGKWLMDEIGRLVTKSQDDEGRFLQQKEIEDMADSRKAISLLLAGSALSLALLCTVFVLLRREIARGNITEEELRKHRDHLDRLVLERTAQLEQAKFEAEAANRAKSEFLEKMSHEMRNPLAGVMGVLDLLITITRTDEERHYLEMAMNSANSLKLLINDSIDFASNSSGETKPENREPG
jgi:CHASE3 domain sensor protein